jgi:hypothetical protein
MYAAEFTPTSSSPCAPGTICEYRDGANRLQLHGSDNALTELSPGFAQSNAGGDLRLQLIGDVTANSFQTYKPTDSQNLYRPSLVLGVNNADNPGPPTAPQNHAFWLSWNVTPGGGIIDPAHCGNFLSMESGFVGAHAPALQQENHWGWNCHGVQHRVFDWQGYEDDDTTSATIRATTIDIAPGVDNTTTGTSHVHLNADGASMGSGDGTHSFAVTNSQAYLTAGSGPGIAQFSLSPGSSTDTSIAFHHGNLEPTIDVTFDHGAIGSRIRDAYIAGFRGGCRAVASRPPCDAVREGGWFSTCAVGGVSNGVEQVCHCTSGGSCSWINAGQAAFPLVAPDGTAAAVSYAIDAADTGIRSAGSRSVILQESNGGYSIEVSLANQIKMTGPTTISVGLGVGGAAAPANGITSSDVVTATAFKTSTATVATGGGGSIATFTANSVGGAGQPTTATQSGWLKMQDSGGATIWVPFWK